MSDTGRGGFNNPLGSTHTNKTKTRQRMASRFDAGKPRLELNPPTAMLELGKAMTYGAIKYSDNNWRRGMKWTRVLGSLSRHLTAYQAGQTFDPESGLSHMAHVMANAAMLLEFEKTHPHLDDRYVPRGCCLPSEHFSPMCPFAYTFDKEYYERSKPWFNQNYPCLPYYLCTDQNELNYWCGKHNCTP